MALCSEACVSGSGAESSGSEAGSSCLRFGVRSYLHHFYEECSSSVWERGQEEQGFVQSRRARWSSAVWKMSLALGFIILTAGVVSLSVAYSTPHKIESFGEGDLFFVDARAISFNRGLHLSTSAGIWLACLGSALVLIGVVFLVLPRANLKGRLFHGRGEGERMGKWRTKWRGVRDPGEVIIEPPGADEGKPPITLSKVETVQPAS
ncbi:neurensin 1-like [Genypterus blacodes]|uniref:neurensin 1-like n=1 Tax=Genypterus blacodes TaxID=154954 RepID=UPI003F76CB4D